AGVSAVALENHYCFYPSIPRANRAGPAGEPALPGDDPSGLSGDVYPRLETTHLPQRPEVQPYVDLYHTVAVEAFHRSPPARRPIEIVHRTARPDHVGQFARIVHDEAGDTRLDQFGYAAARVRHHRAPREHRLDQDQSERLVPLDRGEKCPGVAQQRSLPVHADQAQVADVRQRQAPGHLPVAKLAIDFLDLAGNT